MKLIKAFLREEDGFGTVEIVLIIAVLVAIALLFRKTITEFVTNALGNVFSQEVEDTTIIQIPT